MSDLIAGLIGVALFGVFLGYYVVGLHAIPFTIIVIGVFALVVADFLELVKKGKDQGKG